MQAEEQIKILKRMIADNRHLCLHPPAVHYSFHGSFSVVGGQRQREHSLCDDRCGKEVDE